VFTARYGLSPYRKQIRLVFITEVRVFTARYELNLYITQIRFLFIVLIYPVSYILRFILLDIFDIRRKVYCLEYLSYGSWG
jgi:hypothetical protein